VGKKTRNRKIGSIVLTENVLLGLGRSGSPRDDKRGSEREKKDWIVLLRGGEKPQRKSNLFFLRSRSCPSDHAVESAWRKGEKNSKSTSAESALKKGNFSGVFVK